MRLATWLRRPTVWAPISLALLAVVAWRSRLWEAGDRLGHVDIQPLAAALALSALIPVLWAVRSAALLRAAGRPVPVRPLIPMTALANTVNNLTPGSSGEILRLWLLRAHHGVDYATGGAVIVVERVAALASLSGSAVLFWLAVVAELPPLVVFVALAVLVALPGVAYGLGVRPSRVVAAVPLGRAIGRERWARLGSWLRRVDDTIATLLTRPMRLVSFAAATGGILACYTLQLILVGRALGISLDPVAAWGALGLGLTAGVLSLLPFGLGSTDFVVASLLGVVGVPPIEATAMTFGYRLVSTVPLALAGVVSYALLSAGLPDASALMSAVTRDTVGADESEGGFA
jgi:uncharacterized protein (TIRG00374 family)